MPRVFLSHSSEDKNLVKQVYEGLQILSEMDEFTFEAGLPNRQIIVRAFQRCDLFALFLSHKALSSSWVNEEISEARRRLKRNEIKRLLVFCVDGFDFHDAPQELRDFAFFLGYTKPSTIIRAIQRHFTEVVSLSRPDGHAFVGRDDELTVLKDSIVNSNIPKSAISVSGLSLMGRRDIIYHTMLQLKPRLYRIPNVIDFEIYMSCADIALELRKCVAASISPDEISDLRNSFAGTDAIACGKALRDLLLEITQGDEYVVFSDRGGIINNAGGFTNIMEGLLSANRDSLEPTLFIITQRKPVARARIARPEIAFLDIDPLKPDAARKYVLSRMRAKGINLNNTEIDETIKFAHGHPQNIDFILEKIKLNPPAVAVLRNLDDILEIGRDRATNFLKSLKLSSDAQAALAVSYTYPDMPAEFVSCVFEDFDRGLKAFTELQDNHVIIQNHGIFTISPPLRDAVGRYVAKRKKHTDEDQKIAGRFVAAIAGYQDDNTVPINIIDAASVAALQTGKVDGNFVSYYVLPSHYIYLAKMCYDQQQYDRAALYAESAVKNRHSLTLAAYIEACRWLGLSRARIGDDTGVGQVAKLLYATGDAYGGASGHFIQGFSFRLSGRYVDAKALFDKARPTLGRNLALLRESALVDIAVGEYEGAIASAEAALEIAHDNPYLLDIVARGRLGLATSPAALLDDPAWISTIERLRKSGSSDGFSFYQLRMAELAALGRKWPEALKYVDAAQVQTPDLMEILIARARIRLASGDVRGAKDDRVEARRRQETRLDARHRVDVGLLELEIALAIKSRSWREGILFWENLEKIQGLEVTVKEHQDAIRAGIGRDKRDLPPDIRNF